MTMVSGTSLGRIVIIAVSPIITRLYAPAEVGNYAAILAAISIILVVADLSYHAAIALPERDEDAINIVALSLTSISLVGAVLGIVMWASDGVIFRALGVSTTGDVVPLIIAGQFFGGMAMTFSFWTVRARRFRATAVGYIAQNTTIGLGQVALGLLGIGAAGLLGGWVLGAIVGAAVLGYGVWSSAPSAIRQISPTRMWSMAKRYRRFTFLTTPSLLANTIGLNMPIFLLLFAYGSEIGGQYALAERVAVLPVTLIAHAVSQVYYAHAAPMARRNDETLEDLYRRTTVTLARYALIPMIFVAVAAPIAFAIVFGADWVQAGLFAAILTPWFYITLVTNPTGPTLDVLERQDLHLVREALRLAILVVVSAVVIVVKPPPVGAVVLLAVAGCITYGVYGYLTWRAIKSDRPRPGAIVPSSDPTG